MANIVTWEYYSSLSNKVTEEEFPALEKKAELIVRDLIGYMRWITINEETFAYVALQDCICNLIDKLHENEISGVGSGVTSVSNDGYSETYAVGTKEEAEAELQRLAKIWLSGTGLVGAY